MDIPMPSRISIVISALVVLTVGCGADSTDTDEGDAAPTGGDAAAIAETDDGSESSTGGDDANTYEAIAYRVSGPDGSVVEVEQTLESTAGAVDQSTTHTLEGASEGTAFSNFISAAELEFVVTEGGPVTAEVFTTPVDLDAPPFVDFDTIEITEAIAEAEATVDAPVTLSAP